MCSAKEAGGKGKCHRKTWSCRGKMDAMGRPFVGESKFEESPMLKMTTKTNPTTTTTLMVIAEPGAVAAAVVYNRHCQNQNGPGRREELFIVLDQFVSFCIEKMLPVALYFLVCVAHTCRPALD